MRNMPASSTFLTQWPLSAKLSPSVYRIPLVLRPLASPIGASPSSYPTAFRCPVTMILQPALPQQFPFVCLTHKSVPLPRFPAVA